MTDPAVPDSRACAWSWRVLTGIPMSHHSRCPVGQSSCSPAWGLAMPLLHASLRGEDLPPLTPLVSSLGGSCFSENKYILGLPENRGRGANPETVAPACSAPPSRPGSGPGHQQRTQPVVRVTAVVPSCWRLDAHTSRERTRADLWGVPEAPPDCSLP
uniref:Uncharacterized protein n=1 Tax=Rangifer tarandus platyrhynchus TaxID=3082113 RepID=A0ACB0E5S7_RANTA|nr:unnamed protein product [Rangifer tarandus platyrhynchus]